MLSLGLVGGLSISSLCFLWVCYGTYVLWLCVVIEHLFCHESCFLLNICFVAMAFYWTSILSLVVVNYVLFFNLHICCRCVCLLNTLLSRWCLSEDIFCRELCFEICFVASFRIGHLCCFLLCIYLFHLHF